MTVISDQDWEQVNAYHDGEMDPRDALAFEKRLRNDSELAAALDRVRSVTRSLAPLRPRAETSEIRQAPVASKWKWVVGGALAASILVAAIALQTEKNPGAMEIHATFLEQSFAVGSGDVRMVAGDAAFPDLGAANLTFVAARETELGIAAHYAGRNGCRLTFLAMPEPARQPSGTALQFQQWSFGERYFAILASGMDAGKFSAIADYLRQETRRAAQPETVLALRDATQSANRCV